MGLAKRIVPMLPHNLSEAIWLKTFHQNPLPWAILSFFFCYKNISIRNLKAISYLFRLSEVLWHVKVQVALNSINLLPTTRKGSRILEVESLFFRKHIHSHIQAFTWFYVLKVSSEIEVMKNKFWTSALI